MYLLKRMCTDTHTQRKKQEETSRETPQILKQRHQGYEFVMITVNTLGGQ